MNFGLLGTALCMGIAAIGSAFGIGIASGLAMAVSAFVQGKAGAAGADALAETGKGFSQYITVVGLCETVALFALVFSMVALG